MVKETAQNLGIKLTGIAMGATVAAMASVWRAKATVTMTLIANLDFSAEIATAKETVLTAPMTVASYHNSNAVAAIHVAEMVFVDMEKGTATVMMIARTV